MAADVLIFAAGLLAWTLLEYVIHGLLSHRLRTFATALHAAHHLAAPDELFGVTNGFWDRVVGSGAPDRSLDTYLKSRY
jgi:sterol desaturase/sphingolipid hydroxylase (fatty acid hydroxylase superfamily)